MTFRNIVPLLFVFTFLFSFSHAGLFAKEEIRVTWSSVTDLRTDPPSRGWRVLIMVRPESRMESAAPEIRVPATLKVESIHPKRADLEPGRFTLFYVHITSKEEWQKQDGIGVLEVSLPGRPALKTSIEIAAGIDLTSNVWESFYAGEGTDLSTVAAPPYDGVDWKDVRLPGMWNEIGITWIRTRFHVPEFWKGRSIRLTVPAIDDNDISYINDREIGRTAGWDTLREYDVPDDLLKYGEDNVLLIAVHNTNHGGGIAHGPIRLGRKTRQVPKPLFPAPELQAEADRQPARKAGDILPLRPMRVRDGLLQYRDGTEVTLWGVNYYPQSWHEYRYLKEQGVDFKKAIHADLDDLLGPDPDGPGENPRRINAIRIHVFDSEICDSRGGLVRNEHLDLLDYLVDQCNKRGIYLWLTPIAWWGSPQGLPDCFASRIPMQAMTLCRETWPAQERYLKSFLEHENLYTKRRLIDEPCLVLLENVNEPLYWSLEQLTDLEGKTHGRIWCDKKDAGTDRDPNVAFRKKLRREWNESLPDPSWESVDTWAYFQYRQLIDYIDTMYEAIRKTGAGQPIAYSASGFNNTPSTYAAVGDSRCEAVTLVFYTGLEQKPVADAVSQLPKTADTGLPIELSGKARLVYEFDASDTLKQVDNYPAIARHFRNLGVQVACQFQYDSRFNAAHNRAWVTHYLNVIHTPERFASFLIAGETFRTLPRGTRYQSENIDRWIFPPAAVSYSRNVALLCKDNLYMQAGPTDWMPLQKPERPTRILAVGSTPYYDYDGSGLVDLALDGDSASLTIGPDVIRLKHDTLSGTPEEPLTRLERGKHFLKLKLPGWKKATVEVKTETGWRKVADEADRYAFEADNRYRLKRK